MIRNLYRNGKNFFNYEHSNILSAAFIIMIAVFLSALLGVLRNRLLISNFYETKELLDVYWAAFRLPDMIFQLLVVGALSAAFIPVFSDMIAKDKEEANRVASSIINFVVFVLLILAAGIFIFARPLSELITSGFTSEQIDLMANLTRVMIVAQIFFGYSSFLTGIIQSHKRFLLPALSPLLYNLGIIAGIVFLSDSIGIYAPAVGVVVGAFLHLLVQLPLTRTLGFHHLFTSWDFRHPKVVEMLRLMFPRTLALSVTQIEQTAMVFFATSLPSGSLTMINIAQQLSNLPVRLFGMPIGQASLPFFAKEKAQNELEKLVQMVSNTFLEILYLALPASVIILVLRIPFVRMAYGAKEFPWSATVMTGKIVAILAIGIVARAISHLLIRVFYALHNTKTPFFIGVIASFINIALNYFFIFTLRTSILGLAVANVIAALVETGLLLSYLYFQEGLKFPRIFVPSVKMIVSAVATAIFLWVPLRMLDQLIFDTTRTSGLILLTSTVFAIGLSIYLLFSYLLRIEQLYVFRQIFEKIGNWKKVLGKTEEALETAV